VQSYLRNVSWLAFFGLILAAWWILYSMSSMAGLNLIGVQTGHNMMMAQAFSTLFWMWAIMMAAMMLPTMVPTLRSYDDLIASANGNRAGWYGVALGYFAIWVCFAVLIAALQLVAFGFGWLSNLGMATSLWTTAVLLAIVGAYQFTWVKDVCSAVCRSPMVYFLQRWQPGFVGGLRMGLGLGVYCVLCCWGFMALGFVGGTMNLLWMGAATLFMVLEKLPQVATYVAKPLGAGLVVSGIIVAAKAAGLF
jgi:predicted metal-binding membrane protein